MSKFPEFLEPFTADLEQYKMSTIKIKAKALKKEEVLPIEASKFLGTPAIPVGVAYPLDANGEPMVLLVQINFADLPDLSSCHNLKDYPNRGLFQVFVSSTDWYDCEDLKMMYHDVESPQFQSDFSFLTKEHYEELPIWKEHQLKFKLKHEYGCVTDERFDYRFNGLSVDDLANNLNRKQANQLEDIFQTTGHKLGGYAYYVEADVRGEEEEMLLQIDVDDYIMFGDSGLAHIFIKREDLKNRNFEQARLQWDCC